MSEESHSPYHSKRIRVGTISSPKDFAGMLERTVEITFGNQETNTIRNKEDISDILQEKDMITELETLWTGLDKWAVTNSKTFIDNVEKKDD